MEGKKQQIRKYLDQKVNPILKPMLEDIVRKRPNNVLTYILNYINQQINQNMSIESEQEEDNEEFQAEFLKKLQEKKKKKAQKKSSRQGISAQSFGIFNRKDDFIHQIIQKSKETEENILKLIEKSILFQALTREDLNVVIQAMEVVQVEQGAQIITEGEQGNTLYVVGEGEYDCSKVIKGKQTYLKTYKPGQAFGELALMYNAPRAASIKAKTSGVLYELDRKTFNNIVQEAAVKKRKYYNDIMSKVDILAEIDPYEKQQLCDALKEEHYNPQEYIVQQGQQGNKFFIICEGNLIAERKENSDDPIKQVFQYKEGDYFGEIALVKNTVRQASIKAITFCRVVSIDSDAFKRLLGPIEGILQRNMEKYKKYIAQ